jgi:hypothetical protein
MRLRQRDLRTVYLKKRIPGTEDDGTSYEDYVDTSTSIQANIHPAGGKLMAEMYGQRLAYMKTMRYEGDASIEEGDGLCVDVPATEKPDYKVVAVHPWDVKVYDLERI